MFEITHKDKGSNARTGVIKVKHGAINTPCFIPVATKAAVKALDFDAVDELGIPILMCNTYHLFLQPGADVVKKLGGLHRFMNWNKPIITDSGGFQAFSLGYGMEHFANKQGSKLKGMNKKDIEEIREIRRKDIKKMAHISDDKVTFISVYDQTLQELTPEKSIEIQHKLGGDIIIALDECTSPLHDYDYVKQSMERTHRWAKRCLDYHKKYVNNKGDVDDNEEYANDNKEQVNDKGYAKQNEKNKEIPKLLLGVVQGGNFPKLRKESARYISSLDFDGFALGGFFGEDKKQMYELVKEVNKILPENKIRHLLGIGTVEDIFLGVEQGIDMFDCNSATRIARSGYAYILPESGGNAKNKFRIKVTNKEFELSQEPLDKNCSCKVCRKHSRAYIRHLFRANEYLAYTLMSYHNLYFIMKLMEDIRNSIEKGGFLELKSRWIGVIYINFYSIIT